MGHDPVPAVGAGVDPEGGVVVVMSSSTDKTTAPLLRSTRETKQLLAFYEFENEGKILADDGTG